MRLLSVVSMSEISRVRDLRSSISSEETASTAPSPSPRPALALSSISPSSFPTVLRVSGLSHPHSLIVSSINNNNNDWKELQTTRQQYDRFLSC